MVEFLHLLLLLLLLLLLYLLMLTGFLVVLRGLRPMAIDRRCRLCVGQLEQSSGRLVAVLAADALAQYRALYFGL